MSNEKRDFAVGRTYGRRGGQHAEKIIGTSHITNQRAEELRRLGFKVLPK